jgi:glycosyltransferase involved in cell wall biosynthesis
MFAIPSVVSDTATFREVISPGRTGLLCATVAEWTSALDRLVCDSKLRLCIGRQAREQARASYGMAVMADNLRTIFGDAARAESADTRPTILIVNVFYPPLAIGGATRVVHDNVRRLAETYGDRFRLEVFTSIQGGEEPYQLSSYVLDGLRVTGVTTPVDPQGDTAASNERMGEIFGRFLDGVAPSLVHFHCVQRLTGSIVSATLERGIPYLVSVHDGWWISDTQFLLDADGQIRLYDYSDPLATMRKLGRPAFDRLMRLRRPLLEAARVLAVSAPFAEIYRGCGVGNVATVANGVSSLPAPQPL